MTEDEKLKVLHDDTTRYKQLAHEVRSFMNRQDAGRFCRVPLRKHLQCLQDMIGKDLMLMGEKAPDKQSPPRET